VFQLREYNHVLLMRFFITNNLCHRAINDFYCESMRVIVGYVARRRPLKALDERLVLTF